MSNYSSINRQYLRREIKSIRAYRSEPGLDYIQTLLLKSFERTVKSTWKYRHSISIYGYLEMKRKI